MATERQIRRHLQRLVDDADGVLRIAIISGRQMPALIEAAQDGDDEAAALFEAVKQAICKFYQGQVDGGVAHQCFCCGVDLRLPRGVVVLTPSDAADGHNGLAGLLCKACDRLPAAALAERLEAALLGIGIKVGRRFDVHPTAGHA